GRSISTAGVGRSGIGRPIRADGSVRVTGPPGLVRRGTGGEGGCPYVLCQGGRDQCLAFELVDEVMLGSPAGWCCCRLRGRWGQAAVTIGTVGALGGE